MVDYSIYKFTDHVNQELKKLQVSYAFQPIFDTEKKVVAHEALMRPENCSIIELITRFEAEEKLHILEVATMFGAFQEYEKRGMSSTVCINSFPTECLTDWENKLFNDTFANSKANGLIELLEYPEDAVNQWERKKIQLNVENVPFAIDDFGTGINDETAVELYRPSIVKLDRSLIQDIDSDPTKQENCINWVNTFHEKNMLVLAEGIETKKEYDYLYSIGIDYFQGFYLGRPE